MADAPIRDLLAAVNSQPTVSTNSAPIADDNARKQRRQELCPIQLTPDETGLLWKEIERSDQVFQKRHEVWKILLQEYIPSVHKSGVTEAVKVNAHFYNSETKIGQLFPRAPRIDCLPKGPATDPVLMPGQMVPMTAVDAGAVFVKQEVLNDYLGPDRINSTLLMRMCIFDALAWSGFGPIKLGFRATMIPIVKPVMGPDQNYQAAQQSPLGLSPVAPPPLVPQMGPDGKPLTTTTMQSIYEEIYGDHFSPLKFRCNADCTSPDIDRAATWVGHWFAVDKETAKREFALTDAEVGHTGSDEFIFEADGSETIGKDTDKVIGFAMWRKASIYRSNSQPHPLAIDHVVLIKGLKEYPVVCRPSPDQEFNEQGQLTNDSLIGFPIQLIRNRVMADSAFIYADNAFTNNQVKELNTSLRQGVELREAAIPQQLYDVGHIDDSDKDALTNPQPKRKIAVKPGALQGGPERIVANIAQPMNTADTYRNEQRIQQVMERTLGISGPQLSTPTATVHSATEIAEASTSFAGRMGTEQDFVVADFIAFARKIDSLIMRYAPRTTQFIATTGADGSKVWAAWDRQMVSGRYSYDIVTDSTWRLDAAQQVRLNLSVYNLFKGDPLFNRAPFMREIIQLTGKNPSLCVLTPAQLAQMAQQGQQQPPHADAAPNEAEMNRTGATPNGPESQNGPSRVLHGTFTGAPTQTASGGQQGA